MLSQPEVIVFFLTRRIANKIDRPKAFTWRWSVLFDRDMAMRGKLIISIHNI